ncbi:MAG: class I SAM-dependent methyltransferase [Chloroflexi bacterium]|nr:class I SAM-dependent methyltransferase [Chloroflexota bacterium]MCC6894698.1 class I SAM-dependent methyltransferase [Anaerolineae bacterium]
MSLRFHEIAESSHHILNPFTERELMLLGEICQLKPEMRQLDLACGKGEMLCQWSHRWGIKGVGVDISPVFLAAARRRASELNVTHKLTFVEADAGRYVAQDEQFDVVSCIGATWIGSGIAGTINLMRPALKPGGFMLIGEPYWTETPPEEAYASSGIGKDDFTSLIGTLDRVETAGMKLVEMVLADGHTWDRYAAAQWLAVDQWLERNANDTEAEQLRQWIAAAQRDYLQYGRRYLGWGVFVLKVK